MESMIDISKISATQLEKLLQIKLAQENEANSRKKAVYESLKAEMLQKVSSQVKEVSLRIKEFYKMVSDETGAFYTIMKEYGALKSDSQKGFCLQDDSFKLEVRSSVLKGFDERGDIAARKLKEFLSNWIGDRPDGENDPVYILAMKLLERNRYGDLDQRSISKLYSLEEKFRSDEFSAVIELFKEAQTRQATTINFYFYEKDASGKWVRLEPSFNRL